MDQRWLKRTVLIAVIIAAGSGCSLWDDGAVGDQAVASATGLVYARVRYVEVGGDCWALDLDDGRRVEPIGLQEPFRVDGLAVEVRLESAPEMLTACQVGEVVRVIEVRGR